MSYYLFYRYAYSGVAYTSAKSGFDIEWCKQCDKGLPKPDLVCFLDTKLMNLNSRENFGEERYETTEFQKLVYMNFNKLFDLNKASDCLVIDAKEPIDVIHKEILDNVKDSIKSMKFSPDNLNTLW